MGNRGEYEDLLTRLLVVDQMPAWTSNRLKRLIRAPKRYLVDAALIPAALRLNAQAVIGDEDVLGRMLDTFVVAQLRPEAVVAESEPRLFHLRTEAGRHEVDVVVEVGCQRVIGIEIKASAAPGAMTRGICDGCARSSVSGSAAWYCIPARGSTIWATGSPPPQSPRSGAERPTAPYRLPHGPRHRPPRGATAEQAPAQERALERAIAVHATATEARHLAGGVQA